MIRIISVTEMIRIICKLIGAQQRVPHQQWIKDPGCTGGEEANDRDQTIAACEAHQ